MRMRPLALAFAIASMAAGALAASTTRVIQSGLVFDRSSLSIAKGDRVLFENRDDVTHNISVFAPDGDATDLGLQKPGVDLNYKFDASGRFTIRCSIHPSMKMTITVK